METLGPPVNPRTQCTNPGCGTMLLSDGSCPRCEPTRSRTTVQKLKLADAYQDEKLRERAQFEIEAGVATGLPPRQPSNDER